MSALPPLPVVVPLLAAAVIAMFASRLSRVVVEAFAVLVSAAMTVICVMLLVQSADGTTVYWFAGWEPRHGVAVGIDFAIDPFGAGAAALASFLVTAALVFGSAALDETVEHRVNILALVFLAGMNGFALTGDLFDMFVFFELMSVCAYALTAARVEDRGPLQGAINFAILVSLAGFCFLIAVALLYSATGALNLAQMGEALARHRPDAVVVAGFTFLAVALLLKAGAVPFHFWVADAYAVTPSPIGMLFGGVMTELALYGLARVYWTVFSGVFAPGQEALGHVLIGLGALTAVVGAVMAFVQQHLRRLLAFSCISHIGLFVLALGLFGHVSLAGVAAYVVGHGMVKGALFLATGVLVYRFGSVDEESLRGKGRELRWTGALFAVGGLALAGLPPFGTFVGKTLLDDGAGALGHPWVGWLSGACAVLTAGAVLRATGRIFLGWGPDEEDRFGADLEGEDVEHEGRHGEERTPLRLVLPAVVLLACGLAAGLVPALRGGVQQAAATFEDRDVYVARVIEGRDVPLPRVEEEPVKATGVWFGLAASAAAVAIGALALFRRRVLPGAVRRASARALGRPLIALRSLHSGHVGDYVAWFVLGLAALGGLFAWALL